MPTKRDPAEEEFSNEQVLADGEEEVYFESGVDFDDEEDEEDLAELEVDFATVPNQIQHPLVPATDYEGIISKVTFRKSQKGDYMWEIGWCMTDERIMEEMRKKLGEIKTYILLTDVNLPRAKALLARIAPELLHGPVKMREIAEEDKLVGKSCRARLGIDDRNVRQYGKRMKITELLRPKAKASFLGA